MLRNRKILLIDNYDSFAYNLVYYLRELGVQVSVYRNNVITVAQIQEKIRAKEIDALVISPGPCTPNESGICLELIAKVYKEIPILGVCLGHQAIGQYFGCKIVKAEPVHGKTSVVTHDGTSRIFDGMPNSFTATRYHSLIIDAQSVTDELRVTASADDGNTIMAIEHKVYPVYGVQFHPESILSEYGHELLSNFVVI